MTLSETHAPAQLNPITERLWLERCQCRRQGEWEQLVEIGGQLLTELLDHLLPEWEQASFEIDSGNGNPIPALRTVCNIAEQQILWQERIDKAGRLMLAAAMLDLLAETAPQAAVTTVKIRRGSRPESLGRAVIGNLCEDSVTVGELR